MARRAFEVLRGEETCGFVGEGRGPFVSAARWSLPDPVLADVRFTSRSVHSEHVISEVLGAASDFEGAMDGLVRAGFSLKEVDFFEAFGEVL